MFIERETQQPQTKEYEVQEILDRKTDQDDNLLYLVKWVGWPKSQATWEPLGNLFGNQAIERMILIFDENILKKSKKWSSKPMDGTLNSWRIHQNHQNINSTNLPSSSYKKVPYIDIDQQQVSCEQITSLKSRRKSSHDFMSHIRRKLTFQDNSKYPFQQTSSYKRDYSSNRKIKQIEKVQKIDDENKCFVHFTSRLQDPQWISLDLVRLLYPKMLLCFYESKESQMQHHG